MKVHISLPVSDLEETRKFYTKFFDAEPSKVKAGYVKFEPEDVPLNISFTQAAGKVQGAHFGMQVDSTEIVKAQRNRLHDLGILESEEMDTVCCYAKQSKVWSRDPDGHMWEIYTVLEDVDDFTDNNATCCA